MDSLLAIPEPLSHVTEQPEERPLYGFWEGRRVSEAESWPPHEDGASAAVHGKFCGNFKLVCVLSFELSLRSEMHTCLGVVDLGIQNARSQYWCVSPSSYT